jgi:hypothetical protein
MILVESATGSSFLFEHDLFRKPVPTFRDHALAWSVGAEMAQHVLAYNVNRVMRVLGVGGFKRRACDFCARDVHGCDGLGQLIAVCDLQYRESATFCCAGYI